MNLLEVHRSACDARCEASASKFTTALRAFEQACRLQLRVEFLAPAIWPQEFQHVPTLHQEEGALGFRICGFDVYFGLLVPAGHGLSYSEASRPIPTPAKSPCNVGPW